MVADGTEFAQSYLAHQLLQSITDRHRLLVELSKHTRQNNKVSHPLFGLVSGDLLRTVRKARTSFSLERDFLLQIGGHQLKVSKFGERLRAKGLHLTCKNIVTTRLLLFRVSFSALRAAVNNVQLQ